MTTRLIALGKLDVFFAFLFMIVTTDISKTEQSGTVEIKSEFNIHLDQAEEAPLPPKSTFSDWKEARRYAGRLP